MRTSAFGATGAEVARRAMAPFLAAAARGWQAGAIAGGGVKLARFPVCAALGQSRTYGRNNAILFSDLKAAFCSAPILVAAEWHQVLDGIGVPAAERHWLASAAAGPALTQRGLPESKARLLRLENTRNDFVLKGGSCTIFGMHPGDALVVASSPLLPMRSLRLRELRLLFKRVWVAAMYREAASCPLVPDPVKRSAWLR